MSVKPRGNGWEAYVTFKGKKFRRTLSTKEDATVLEAMWQREVAQGKMPTKMDCLLYTSPSPRDGLLSRMPSSA